MEYNVRQQPLNFMRYPRIGFALSVVIATQGCLKAAVALEAIAPKCTQEQIVVTWPITMTRGSAVTTTLLTRTLTQNNIARAQFDALRQTLVDGGGTGTYNVTWTIPAFDVNGGYISLSHSAPLTSGETQQVGVVFSGGGWEAQPVTGAVQPAVAVRASNFVATAASGLLTAITGTPLRLAVDITTTNAAGETIRLGGEAGFSYHKVQALCS